MKTSLIQVPLTDEQIAQQKKRQARAEVKKKLRAIQGGKPKDGFSLYAIAYERVVNNAIYPGILHLHAQDAGHAHVQFFQDPDHWYVCRIIAIAPVIGYHADDEHGEKLRA